jgi:hypothetical protein
MVSRYFTNQERFNFKILKFQKLFRQLKLKYTKDNVDQQTFLQKKTAQSESFSQGEIYFGFGRVGSGQDFFDHIFHQARRPEHFISNT